MRGKYQGTKLPGGGYQVRVTVTLPDGTKKKKSVKRKTLKDAQAAAAKIAGTAPISVVTTFDELVEAFRNGGPYATYQPSSKTVFDWTVAFSSERFGKRPLGDVKPPMVYQMVRELSAAKKDDGEPLFSGRTVQMVRNTAKSVFKYGVLIGLLDTNPAQEVPLVRSAKRKAPPIVSIAVVEKAIEKEPNPKYRAYWRLLYWSGMRPHKEASAVGPDDCWEEDGMGWFLVRESKTDAGEREIPVPLEVYRECLPFLPFGLNRSNVLREWRQALERIEEDYFPPYQLRSLRYNLWKQLGVDDLVITGAMGHVDEQTGRQHYGRTWRSKVSGALGVHYVKTAEPE